jgi:hypothetical protein
MPKMTKAQARKRMKEVWSKINRVALAQLEHLPRTTATDLTAIGKILDKWERALK